MRALLVSAALAGTALWAPCTDAHAQSSPLWRSVDMSRQLRDTLPQRIRVQYGAGHVDVRGASEPLLYAMHLRYDERRGRPLHRYDAEQRTALLGVDSRGAGLGGSPDDGDGGGELRLGLPRTVPLDLDLDLGGTDAALDLGGLMLQSLRVECGVAEARLSFTTPNRARMRELEVNVGAGDLTALRLANANADLIRVRGGVGSVDLDLGGTWTRDLAVVTRMAVGTVTLHVPSDVGVRVELQRIAAGFHHEGLEKRDDGWYSPNWDTAPHKLRIRAETYFGKVRIRHTAR